MKDNLEISLDGILHCPVCGREIDRSTLGDHDEGRGYQCSSCGEFVPEALALNSVEGCTHGRECNCSRSMRR